MHRTNQVNFIVFLSALIYISPSTYIYDKATLLDANKRMIKIMLRYVIFQRVKTSLF